MKRMIAAGLLALPALLLAGPAARAQDCYGGFGAGGPAPSGGTGCRFCFRLFGGAFTQEGPLFNYGPYSGYYPFAPYGPWGSDLSYHGGGAGGCGGAGSVCGWNHNLFGRHGRGHGGHGNCGVGGCDGGRGFGHGGLGHGRLGLGGGFGHSDCGAGGCGGSGGWGQYSMTTMRGVFHRCHPLGHRAKLSTGSCAEPASGCSSGCGASAVGGSTIQSVSGETVGDSAAASRGFRER